MPRSLMSSILRKLYSKDDDRNLISATFQMITITLISMSMVDLSWFTFSGDFNTPNLTLGLFFWFGYTGSDINYANYEFVNTTIVNMMRTTILLCFMAIIFSLAGFFLDIIGPKYILYRMIRKYAVAGTFTVLWIMAIISVSYYIVLLLEESLDKMAPEADTTVNYGFGFYFLASAGGVALIGIFYNLILVHPPEYYREDDRCLIANDDGLDTFNSPTPPPPYNVPPPPYTP